MEVGYKVENLEFNREIDARCDHSYNESRWYSTAQESGKLFTDNVTFELVQRMVFLVDTGKGAVTVVQPPIRVPPI